jgi:hypothetical protein
MSFLVIDPNGNVLRHSGLFLLAVGVRAYSRGHGAVDVHEARRG